MSFLPIIYMLSIFLNGQEEISRFGKMATMINFLFVLIIPPILLIITLTKGMMNQRRTE